MPEELRTDPDWSCNGLEGQRRTNCGVPRKQKPNFKFQVGLDKKRIAAFATDELPDCQLTLITRLFTKYPDLSYCCTFVEP